MVPVDDVVRDALLWLLKNFPAAVVVYLLVQLRARWDALLKKTAWLSGKVNKLMELHARRHKDDALEIYRDEEED